MIKAAWKIRVQRLKESVRGFAAPRGAPQKPKDAPKSRVSPLAPKGGFPALPVIKGVSFATAAAGVKYASKDVALIQLAPGSTIAGAFTRSSTRASCVRDCQAKLSRSSKPEHGAAILVNSGNANAFTGKAGEQSIAALTQGVALALGVPETRVFTSSTGVIGEPLPHAKITAVIPQLTADLREDSIKSAAQAIMTTDTFPKGASAVIETDGGPIHISGIAKGSGMIAPDMATMLVYIFTDASLGQAALQRMVTRCVHSTFNAITVDSDTSTSDSVIVAATGQSPARPLKGAAAKEFEQALHAVMHDLALQVVRDGEGASKLMEVRVSGAASQKDAAKVAFSIANSPLVKTAVAGEDPNWGRIIAAIGKSGAKAERDRLSIHFGPVLVAKDGWRAPSYREEDGAAHFRGDEIIIAVDLGIGKASQVVWGCDLTARYVEINADYRS